MFILVQYNYVPPSDLLSTSNDYVSALKKPTFVLLRNHY